jgi:methyl-accepting chemotaxis protein
MAGSSDLRTLADFYATQVSNPQLSWMESLTHLRAVMAEAMTLAAAGSQHDAANAQRLTTLMMAVALAMGLLSAFLISRSIGRPLRQAVALARAVAKGDLSADVPPHRRDEIGAVLVALADMQASLRRLVGDIGTCADALRIAGAEVSAGNSDLSRRTELSAGSLQQIVARVREQAVAVKTSADAAEAAGRLAASASAAAQRGGEVVDEVVANMGEIAASSRRIADITATIDGIAFRTNLLALNAPSKPRARASRAAASPSSPPRYARWRSRPPSRPPRSRR